MRGIIKKPAAAGTDCSQNVTLDDNCPNRNTVSDRVTDF